MPTVGNHSWRHIKVLDPDRHVRDVVETCDREDGEEGKEPTFRYTWKIIATGKELFASGPVGTGRLIDAEGKRYKIKQ